MAKADHYASKEEFAKDLAGVDELNRLRIVKVWERYAQKYDVEIFERGDQSLVDYVWELRTRVRAAKHAKEDGCR